MKYVFLFINSILLLFVLISCTNRTDTNNLEFPKTIYLNLSDASSDSFNLSSIASKVEYIPLQTSDSSILNYIYDFNITKNYYFLGDEGCVFVYDNNGKFIKKLYQIGHGPGETSTRSFTLNESKELVYVLDIYNGEIMVYDFLGRFIEKIDKPINMVEQTTASIGYFNNKLVVTTAQVPQTKFLYSFFDLTTYSIQNFCKNNYVYDPSQIEQRPALIYWIDRTYQAIGSNLIFKEWFNDTIFNVNNEFKIEPKYILDLDKKKLEWITWRDHGMFNLKQGLPSGYWVQSFIESSSFLFISLNSFKEKRLFAIFDKRNNMLKILSNKNYDPRTNNQVYLKNNLDNIIAFPAMNKSGNIFYYDNCLYSIVEAKDFVKTYQSISDKDKNATQYLRTIAPELDKLNEFSNPVMIKVYLN